MDETSRKALREDLTRLSGEIAAGLRAEMLVEGSRARERARKLHADEKVGDGFDVWTDLLARRGAVLWVLKSVYVRVLEDRGLLVPGRILDAESQGLFEHLAPNLGPTAYLRWVYRDLASVKGGLPELFAPQPAEIGVPSDAMSQRLLDLWRKRDTETGALVYRFDEEHFDGRLMGDLYQDLDPVVKKRYALLQTPDFILDFILDETLTPAIAEWGVETVRVLDPACGSGHFLLAAFKRLVAGMREKRPDKAVREVVQDVLGRVVGIDLNDYACALARARLIMTALEVCGESDLGAATGFHPQVYWADALEQVEREDLGQIGLFGNGKNGRPKALLTRPEVRDRLRPIMRAGFHAVVGNPPFDTEKDPRQRAYHMENTGKRRRYEAASGQYSLGPVFAERFFQAACQHGFVGLITANSFVKRQFGKPFIEKVLTQLDLRKVIDASAVVIPGAGIRAILLFGNHRPPSPERPIRFIMGKRAEPRSNEDPATGKIWRSILEGHTTAGWENDFISVADLPRSALSKHPWSTEGGGALNLKARIEKAAGVLLATAADDIGFVLIIGEDEIFLRPRDGMRWAKLPRAPLIFGDEVRDWESSSHTDVLWPLSRKDLTPSAPPNLQWELWPFRRVLEERIVSGTTSMRASGRAWYDLRRVSRDKFKTSWSIVFSDVSTHNNFGIDRLGSVFNRTAPVVKLRANAPESEYLTLLGQLNSSSACFWFKQVCHSHGEGGGSRVTSGHGIIGTEAWKNHYAHDVANVSRYPLVAT
jgi:SAM-dependent methyltransferase